ncbi:MAG: hypothetical protein ABFC67_14625 [Mizugakiibacter sp.]|uniref:hypothetical protein n=1 Tax=Mizugakiibacter sp. TaxID=1972610 RepID=UPI00320D216C
MSLETRQFNFLSVLTAIVVVGYVVASGWAFVQHAATWQEFSGAVGPIAGTLLGYWLRGRGVQP